MSEDYQEQTIVIGGRELAIGAAVLAVVALVVFLIIWGTRRSDATASEVAGPPDVETATPTVRPTLVPLATLTPTPAEEIPVEPTPAQFEHVVAVGESLASLARLYNIPVQDLLLANNLTLQDMLLEGQRIIIPLPPDQAGRWHEVQPGETLFSIAQTYGVTVEAIQSASNLREDVIVVGQRLRIPGVAPEATPTAEPEAPPEEQSGAEPGSPSTAGEISERLVLSSWSRSILEGALDENYPLLFEHPRFTVHYQPETFAARDPAAAARQIEQALNHVEAVLDVRLSGTFDVYLAGTLFAAPNAHLRGWSKSASRLMFILYDGSGTEADNAYFIAHELAHLVSWNTWGPPSSTMLSEGLATYAGKAMLEEGGYLPFEQLCLAIYSAGQMPPMTSIERDWQAFLGHINDPFNYFGSACFIEYLVEKEGLSTLRELYRTSNYTGLYGDSLAALDAAWRAGLEARLPRLILDANQLAARSDDVDEAYRLVFSSYNSTRTMHNAYAALDQARVALWKGDYAVVPRWLDVAYKAMGYTP